MVLLVLLMIQILNLVGFFFLIVALIILLFQMKQHITKQIFQLISVGQLGFFLLFCSLFIVYSVDSSFRVPFIDTINSSLFLLIVLRMGILCGFIGVLFWILVIEILHFDEDINILGNILLLRSAYILLGLATGVTLFDTSEKLVNKTYELTFSHPITYILVFFMYALFFIFQVSLLRYRGRKFQHMEKISVSHAMVSNILILVYYSSFCSALILFLIDNIFHLPNYSIFWVLFGLISQIIITILIILIPVTLLTTEEPRFFMILTESGTSIYARNFTNEITIPEQLIAAYISALDSLGSKIISSSGIVTSVKFEDLYTFINTSINTDNSFIRFCYIYKGISYYASTRLTRFSQEINRNNEIWNEIITSQKEGKKMLSNNKIELQINKYFPKVSY